jgi:FtsH-binding integral membrane protein
LLLLLASGPLYAVQAIMSIRYYSIEDKDRLRSRSNVNFVVALACIALTVWLQANETTFSTRFPFILFTLFFVGEAFFFAALAYLAKSKGYSWAYGFLTAFQILGLAILIFLPDRWDDQKVPTYTPRKLSW